MRNRLLPVLATAGALALALTACTGAQPDGDAPPVVEVESIDALDALLPSSASAYVGYGMVAASDDLPWMLGGALAEPGETASPTVWTSTDGSSWKASTVGDAKGAFSGVVKGSDSLAALGGTLWSEGSTTSALWTSTDGEEWTSVKLPDEFLGEQLLTSFAVEGDAIFGIGVADDGDSIGMLIDGGTASIVELPEVSDDELLGAHSVALAGDTVVLLANTGEEGDPSPTVSYTSDDGGKSWGKAATITDAVGSVSGIAATDEGFVVTGSTPRGDGANGLAAWFSPDGASWTAESVPDAPQDGALYTFENSDTWLSTPLQRDGVVTAIFGNDNSALSGVYARQPGGAWSFVAATSANSTNGAAGVVLPGDNGSYVGAIIGSSYARAGMVLGGWSDTTVLAEREDIATVVSVYPTESGAQLTLNRSTFTVESDLGWRNQSAVSLAELDGDELAEVTWDPEAAASWSGTQLVTDDSGAQLVIGSFFDYANNIIPVQGYFRSSADAEWQPVTGFEPGGAAALNGAEKIGDVWIAFGTSRATSAAADPRHAAIWTSADGLTWTRASSDFGSGTLESELADVCALPNGDLIGVGWTEVSAGDFRTSVWGGGDWSTIDIGALADKYGFATSCASDDEGVILGASVGGRDTLQRSTDGAKWKEVFRADRGIYIGEPVAVEGGFAASGSSSVGDFSGPVVWLSKTGTEWSPVSIPSRDDGSTSRVAAVGDDLLVAMHGRTGDPLVVIRDIAKVIDEKG